MKTDYIKLTQSFEELTLNPINFRHIDHIGVAYVMLSKYDFITAIYKYSNNINRIATKAGAAKKFNVTITLAFLSLISERMLQSRYKSANEFLKNNQDLIKNNQLKKLYSEQRLQSESARVTFLMPDNLISNTTT